MLVLSQYVEESYALELLADDAEGVGYLLKDRVADVDRFIDAVRRVADGGSALDPEVVSQLLGRRRRDDPLEELTPREREVLGLMAEGRSNQAIAEQLVVTERAVEKHVTSIFSKLDLAASAAGPPPRARGAGLPARLRGGPFRSPARPRAQARPRPPRAVHHLRAGIELLRFRVAVRDRGQTKLTGLSESAHLVKDDPRLVDLAELEVIAYDDVEEVHVPSALAATGTRGGRWPRGTSPSPPRALKTPAPAS